MRRFTRYTVVICLAAALVILPMASGFAADTAAAGEESPSLPTVLVDTVMLRPLGIASTVLGLVGYAVSLPFSIPGGNNEVVWENLVEAPVEYTFKRPIGEF